jgi:subtilisin family serine protease
MRPSIVSSRARVRARVPALVVAAGSVLATACVRPDGEAVHAGAEPRASQVTARSSSLSTSENFRVTIKLRASRDERVARRLTAGPAALAKAIDLRGVAAADPELASLFSRIGVRSARPLHAGRLRARQPAGLTDAQLGDRTRARFGRRAARAPAGAAAPDLSAQYVLDLGPRTAEQRQEVLSRLRADAAVLRAEEDGVARASFVPDDPRYPELYGLARIGAAQAWDVSQGQGVVVAVVDTGLDRAHPDIDANAWVNPAEIPSNGVDDDGNGYVDDWRGWDFVGVNHEAPVPDNEPDDVHRHGTHVAGTVAAEGNNGLGVIGAAWRARIMPLKGLDDSGSGGDAGLAEAIVYAADQGADVINASWGRRGASQVVGEAIDYAHALGVVFVAAAGNDGDESSNHFPASFPNAIAVSALDAEDQLAEFSNFGFKVDLSAPGVGILSLQASTGDYFPLSGTSMAAPHVAGVAALVLARHPELTSDQVRQILRASATDLGPAGKDAQYGYGRVDAARAVGIDQAPPTRIRTPGDQGSIYGPVAVTGDAGGPGFARYILDYGAGAAPGSWTVVRDSTTPVLGGTLGTFDPGAIAEGLYTLRLRVISQAGVTFSDHVRVTLRYVALTSPVATELPAVSHVMRPGTPLPIVGRATSPGFQRYRVEWAPGRNPTTGWTSAGITLPGGGATPIGDGVLATWATPADQSGQYSIRVVVEGAGGPRQQWAPVYLEPDLVSTGWPRHLTDSPRLRISPVPARAADGSTRLVLCGQSPQCLSFAADGSSTAAVLVKGSDWPAAVGDVDPAPGDEVVVADEQRLLVLSATMSVIREIPAPGDERFGRDQTWLADFDGDGRLEIVTTSSPNSSVDRTLYLFRGDGQLFSTGYPLPLGSGTFDVHAAAVDLDRDRRLELVYLVHVLDSSGYQVRALTAAGSPFAGFTPFVSSTGSARLAGGDLDDDGAAEIVIRELSNGTGDLVRVLDASGTHRPGWPAAVPAGPYAAVAIADLDGDRRREIVLNGSTNVTILRTDGSVLRDLYVGDRGFSQVAIADVDDDRAPDLVMAYTVPIVAGGLEYEEQRLRAMSATGALIEDWPLHGIEGRFARRGLPAIGDFNGDGKVDIAVNQEVVASDPQTGGTVTGMLTVLTTGAVFDPALAEWPLVTGGPRHSASRGPAAFSAPLSAQADAYVRDGTSAGSNFGTATSLAVKTSSAGNNRWAYLRFPLTSSGPVGSARLRLHGSRSTATAATDAAFAVASNSWSETGITWNNRPALGAKQGASVTITPTARYYEWDVTAFVAAQKAAGATAVSLAVKMDQSVNESPDSFNAREAGSRAPQLVIVPPPPPPPSITIAPAADAYVRDGTSATLNFGTDPSLVVKSTAASNATRVSYLRFPLTALTGSIANARLRLYGARSVATATTDAVFAVASNGWSETGITWNNRPALGAKQGASVTITPTARYYEWDVTAFVAAQKAAGATAVSLAVKMDQQVTDSPDTFNAREAANNRPELVILGL